MITDRSRDRQTHRWTNRRTDQWTDKPCYGRIKNDHWTLNLSSISKSSVLGKPLCKELSFKSFVFFPDDNQCRFGNQETPFYKMSFFSSSSGSSRSSGQAKGEEWTSEIYFDPEADSSSGSDYRYTYIHTNPRRDHRFRNSEFDIFSKIACSISRYRAFILYCYEKNLYSV